MTSQVEVPPLTGLIHFISGKRRVKDSLQQQIHYNGNFFASLYIVHD